MIERGERNKVIERERKKQSDRERERKKQSDRERERRERGTQK